MWLPPEYNTSVKSDIVAFDVTDQRCCVHKPRGDFPDCLDYRYAPWLSFFLSFPASHNIDLVTGKQPGMMRGQCKGEKQLWIAFSQPFKLCRSKNSFVAF